MYLHYGEVAIALNISSYGEVFFRGCLSMSVE